MTVRACQFPLNDRRPWRFCEAPAQAGSPYCQEHHAVCLIVPGSAQAKETVRRIDNWRLP